MRYLLLTFFLIVSATFFIGGCGGDDDAPKEFKALLFERQLDTTTIDFHEHQPIYLAKKEHNSSYEIHYLLKHNEEIHFCHKKHPGAIKIELFDTNGTLLLLHEATDGCKRVDLVAGEYTLRLSSQMHDALFVHNRYVKRSNTRQEGALCSNSACVIANIDSGGCRSCNFSNAFLAPDLDDAQSIIDFSGCDFQDTTWTKTAFINIDFSGSNFKGAQFGDSCRGDECSGSTDGIYGAGNNFKGADFSDTRFNAGALAGDFSDAKFVNGSISGVFTFYYYNDITPNASQLLPKIYSDRYGENEQMGDLSLFGIDAINGENAILNNIDFSTASIGDGRSNLKLFSMLSLQNVIFPEKINMLGIDLYKSDLSGADFSHVASSMSEANLSYANLHGADLSGMELFDADFHCTDIRGIDANGIDFNTIGFSDTCDNTLYGVNIGRSKNFTNDTIKRLRGYDFDFNGADFIGFDFKGTDLSDFTCKGCRFIGVTFSDVNFTHTDFSYSDMQKATIIQSDISSLDLRNGDLRYIEFRSIDGWKRENFDGSDLRNARFSRMDIDGFDFSDMRLDYTNFSQLHIERANFGGTSLRSADFTKSDIDTKTNFNGAVLDDSDFTLARFDMDIFKHQELRSVKFNGIVATNKIFLMKSLIAVDFVGADLRGSNLSVVQTTERLNFSNAMLDDVDFTGDFHGSDFSGAHFSNGTDFAMTNLSGANFYKSNIENAQLSFKTRFTEADLHEVDFSKTNKTLKGIDFSGANCEHTKFHNTDLTGANFNDAKCAYASFYYTDLSDVDFQGADCEYADFRYARMNARTDLRNTKLRHATFRDSDLADATFSSSSDFAYADISYLDFSARNSMHSMKFSFTTCHGVKFKGVDLSYSSFYGADCHSTSEGSTSFSYATMKGVDISYANMKGVYFNSTDITGTKTHLQCDDVHVNDSYDDHPATKWFGHQCDSIYNMGAKLDKNCNLKCLP